MFCPSCGNNNLAEAQFCRSCGANISLVPQALTGQLATLNNALPAVVTPLADKRGREITRSQAVQTLVMGFGFAAVATALAVTGIGRGWWFWLLIPAFALVGRGIGAYMQVEEHEKRALAAAATLPRAMPPYTASELPPRPFSSITENTTRHLAPEAPTRHLEREK